MLQTKAASATDRFGNPIDPTAGYARGPVLKGVPEEVQRMFHGRALVRKRGVEKGVDSLYLLTGVTRAFPLTNEDLELLKTQLSYYVHFDGKAEDPALAYVGGDRSVHGACFANRVSSGMLAMMLALGKPGQKALSVVVKGHAHPSLQNACRVAGVAYTEVVGSSEGMAAIRAGGNDFVFVTTVTPQKYTFDEADTRMLIASAHDAGALVIVDDAHGAVRTSHFGQAPVLQLGEVGIALLSMDKHLIGPRTALIVGRQDLVTQVSVRMYQFGLEAPFANYVAALRAIDTYDPERIARASEHARELYMKLKDRLAIADDDIYIAGPGIAFDPNDLTSIVVARAKGRKLVLAPIEISSIVAMRMVETEGLVTILAIGMPGASAPLRVLLFPDGERAGTERMTDAVADAVTFTARFVDDMAAAREYLCAPVTA